MDPIPFWSARRRLTRADKHISDFDAAAKSYFDTEPFKATAEVNATRSYVFHKLLLVNPVPDILTDCAFDAISNLRASLDSAAYTIVLAHNPSVAENIHFPIADTATYFINLLAGKSRPPYPKAFPADIHSVLRRLEPYERGDGHLLWTLNRVRRQAEHRMLIRCVTQASFRLTKSAISPPGAEFQFFEYVEGGEDGVVFAIRRNEG